MFVSVIIPTFNRALNVESAIRSALAQNYPDFEVIVVDDGSTDETPYILNRLDSPRLRVLRQANKGVSAARNAAIEAAQGDIIALLDSDDVFLPGKLAAQTRFMQEHGLDISQTREIWIRRGLRVNPMDKHVQPSGWIFPQCLDMCRISPSTVMFNRKVWTQAGPFDENLPACEDYDLWLRVALRFPVGLVDQAYTVKQGGHADQLSRSFIGLDLFRIRALLRILDDPALTEEPRRLVERQLRRKARILVRGGLKRGRVVEPMRVKKMVESAIGPIFAK